MQPGSTTLIDILNCPSLPSLPSIAVKLLELTSDPDVGMKEIAQLVSTDQALSAKVLKTVNSSYYGLSSPCGSIERALGYLGLNTVKSLVLGFSLVETTALGGESGFDMMGHWRRAILGATGARVVAKQLKLCDPDEVFTAALFQDMGVLAAFTVLKGDYAEAIGEAPHGELCAAEQEAYGFDHTEAGEALAELWKLPDEICLAIRYHHNPDEASSGNMKMIQAVAMGTLAAEAMSSESCQEPIERLKERALAWFGEESGLEIEPLLEEIAESSKTLAKMFEQDIGVIPNPAMLMAQAQEKGLELQFHAQKAADTLARESVTDGLTKIANRKRFDTEMSRYFGDMLSNGRLLSVLFFDADKFKSVNDTYGHTAGDVVLIELAKRASDVVGEAGLVCRYGGEEFVVILPNMGVDRAAALAERIRSKIAETPFDTSEVDDVPDTLPITVSIGVSGSDAGSVDRLENPADLVLEADKGVYAAKDAGRNNVQVWGRFTQAKDDAPVSIDAAAGLNTGTDILLIEDDALAATLIMSLLKRRSSSPIKVDWISSGDEALSRVQAISKSGQNPYCAVVCDLDLPKIHGLEILASVRAIDSLKDLPFFILTAHGSKEDHQRAKELGATEFINKVDFCKDLGVWLNKLISLGTVSAQAA